MIKELILDELRNVLLAQLDGANELDDKLLRFLNLVHLIQFAAVAFYIAVSQFPWFLLSVSALYFASVLVTLWALRPMDWAYPIPPTWDEIADRYFDASDNDALETLISTHLNVIEKNDVILSRKARAVRVVSVIIVAILVVFNFALWVSLA